MGGPTGFAVTTTTATTTDVATLTSRMHAASLHDLRRGTTVAILLQTAWNRQTSLVLEQTPYIEMLMEVATEFGKNPITSSMWKIRRDRANRMGDFPFNVEGTSAGLVLYNAGVTRYRTHIHFYYRERQLAKMMTFLCVAKYNELVAISNAARLHRERVGLPAPSPQKFWDDFVTWMQMSWAVIDDGEWEMAVCLTNIDFLRELKNPDESNMFMNSLQRALTNRFRRHLLPMPGFHARVITKGWLCDFLQAVTRTFALGGGGFVEGKYDISEICGVLVETCLSVLRLLCIVPMYPKDDGGGGENTRDTCVGEMHVVRQSQRRGQGEREREMSLLVFLMTMNHPWFEGDDEPLRFRPPWSFVREYLVTDAKIVDGVKLDLLNITDSQLNLDRVNRHYTFFFVLALLHAACEPYVEAEETATEDMRMWFLPLFEDAYHAITYIFHTDPIVGGEKEETWNVKLRWREQWSQSVGVDFTKTQFMRDRVVTTLRKIHDDDDDGVTNVSLLGLDGLMWKGEREEEEASAAVATSVPKRPRRGRA